jgi:curved DNA-binding protein CbpA
MDFYEELGIARSSSDEEIHRAYRNLVRLLHPDRQSDEAVRRLAGIQMLRLNQILETLTDPGLRSQYDDSLRFRSGHPAALPRRGRLLFEMAPPRFGFDFASGNWWKVMAWVGAGTLGILAMVLLLAQDRSVEPAPGSGDTSALTVPRTAAVSGATPSPAVERYGARGQMEAPEPGMEFRNAPKKDSAISGTPAADSPATTRYDFPPASRSHSAGLAGEWFYPQPPRAAEIEGLCQPMYIDLQISESQGTVSGRYSAKYQVGSRPISPFVFFEFRGEPGTAKSDWSWSGPGGSAGRVRLNLISALSLQVDWTTNTMGTELGFSSGTATLSRRQLP